MGEFDSHISLCLLEEHHLDDILQLENMHLTDENICARSTANDINTCLKSKCSVGVFYNDTLVAYSLGYYTEYGTAYIEKCFVSPELRGKGLQVLMLKLNMSHLVEQGAFELFAMTSPANTRSLKNFEAAGFHKKRVCRYNGFDRIIMKYEINN